jgi:hypothetical protein
MDQPCPSCGSWDITEYEIRANLGECHMRWECRECSHAATWTRRDGDDESRATGCPMTAAAPMLSDVAEHQRIAAMPLHAITAAYGESGLRVRFAFEITQLAGMDDRLGVNRALALAAELHAIDRRQREPYINHPLRVALRIICHYGIRDTDVICAALLHDTVEDHAGDLSGDGRPGALAVLAAMFGPRVAELVEAVTNPDCEPGGDSDVQYRQHVSTNLAGCPWARVIKVSDFTDNGVGLIHTTGLKAVKLARKYAPLVPVLRDLTAWPDTPLRDEVKVHIFGQLRRAEERFAAITDRNAASPLHPADTEGR